MCLLMACLSGGVPLPGLFVWRCVTLLPVHLAAGGPLKEQLDLVREAQHLSRFNYNFRNWTRLSFPVPIFPLVSPDVLVESFEEGLLISNYVRNPGQHTK